MAGFFVTLNKISKSVTMKFYGKLSVGLLFIVVMFFSLTAFQNFEKEGAKENTEKVKHKASPHSWTDQTRHPDASKNNCLSCHSGVEPIRDPSSGMMQQIYKLAEEAAYPDNDCIVCHGGNPEAKTAKKAHHGTIEYFAKNRGPKNFYPAPGSPWINENTCGMCHQEQVSTQMTSLMFTEAGKIQGTLWSFGGLNGYNHDVGNYNTSAVDPHQVLGTEKYKAYMAELKNLEPQVYPDKMRALPPAPTADEVQEDPTLAAYTYLRQECQRCHTGNVGRDRRGDYRGLGCASCHIPYSNEGYYEGKDRSISKSERGHLLTHQIQSTRDAKVNIHEHEYSGVPVETCTTCHNRGKRIGVSFQGLMETAYKSPNTPTGQPQPDLHSKRYIHLHEDVHKSKGMLCQDCHTTADVHSDGYLAGATLAPVEIECQDCHGTTDKYPWELPLGYSDEFGGKDALSKDARGLSKDLLEYYKYGTVYQPRDGYLLSARGNPLTNVVKTGDSILLHTAGGKDLILKPLKYLTEHDKLSPEGKVAMVNVSAHMEKMECYTCHATWAPQCYGCHVTVDYSKPNIHKTDWVAVGNSHDEHGLTADARNETDQHQIEGFVTEQRSFLRWENPPLVMNGENRISPAIPGCQVTISVIGKNGEMLLNNHIFKVPNAEGAGEEGQLAIDISPVQPHTITKHARSCEECHNNPQAMGYGIGGGEIYEDPSEPYVVDLTDANGHVLSDKAQVQINSIPNLKMDWSRFVDETGKQLQTVGHHFKSSRPLNNEERNKLDRRGVCLACHQSIPDKDLAVSLMSHMAKYANVKIDTKEHSSILHKTVLLSAWIQVLFGVAIILLIVFIIFRRKKKRKR